MNCDKAAAVENRLNALVAQTGPVLATVGVADLTASGAKPIGQLQVAGGSVAGQGETFEIDAAGFFTTGLAAPTNVTFGVVYGITSLWSLIIPAAGLWANAAAAGWRLRATVSWDTSAGNPEATVAGTVEWKTGPGVSGSVSWFAVSATAGLSTAATANLLANISVTTASTVDIAIKYCHIYRKG